jgi:hypothetical protein
MPALQIEFARHEGYTNERTLGLSSSVVYAKRTRKRLLARPRRARLQSID